MGWFFILALALAAPFLASAYLKRATARLHFADQVWGSLESHAHVLLEDRTLSPRVADFVEGVVNNIGNGSFTRSFLQTIILRPFGFRRGISNSEIHLAINELELGQRTQLFRFMVDAMLYDSLRTGPSGMMLRTIVLYWLVAVARDESAAVSEPQVTPMFAAAGKSFKPI